MFIANILHLFIAAPGIAAGIAAIAGTTVVATAAAALTTTAAVTTIFGVGGGGLVAYKMQRRTIGLTEFEFSKEIPKDQTKPRHRMLQNRASIDDEIPVVELFSTICISGWLRDDCDFQRPWGLSPTHPPIADKLELLERFYSVHRPRHVSKCANILSQWKGEEKQLWDLIRQNYGRDPSHLFPLDDGPRHGAVVSLEEEEVVCQLLSQLGYTATWSHDANVPMRDRQMGPIERMRYGDTAVGSSRSASLRRRQTDEIHVPSIADNDFDNNSSLEDDSENSKTKHLATVWDYEATYGGELYTVRWESSLIEELCNSVTDLAAGVVTGATTHLLKFTALSTLVAAMALPAALKSAANLIDGTWTLVVERADEAGRELANSLLFSSAGNRPVTLAGFSFGARVIYSCLKELARLQGQWEEYQIRRENTERGQYRLNPLSRENIDTYYESMREPASIVGDVSCC